jgi:hypothetical protein
VETMRWLCPIAASCFALVPSANLAAQKVETQPQTSPAARRGYFAPKADGATAQMPAAAPIPESPAIQETPAVKPELSPTQQSWTSPQAAVTPAFY